MEWNDSGIVLSARKQGETSVLVAIFTEHHGRHMGLVRGGQNGRLRGIYQVGNMVKVSWRARLEEHLGNFQCELLKPVAAVLLNDALRLSALSSACALSEASLPERAPYSNLYSSLLVLIDKIQNCGDWQISYAHFELTLLSDLGFSLDLSSCAVTGNTEDLVYISPRSGRAVSLVAGEPWKEKLLPLPAFLLSNGPRTAHRKELLNALKLTGWFLSNHVFQGAKMPPARMRFLDRLGSVL